MVLTSNDIGKYCHYKDADNEEYEGYAEIISVNEVTKTVVVGRPDGDAISFDDIININESMIDLVFNNIKGKQNEE